jgi:hypothetical protein
MIIIMVDDEINQKAAEQLVLQSNTTPPEKIMVYPDINFSNVTDTHITIIDLTADLHSQALLNRGTIINSLQREGGTFPPTVNTIDLIYSNVDQEMGLSKQAGDISFHFRMNFENREVTVRHPHHPDLKNFDYTFIVPPHLTKDKNWHIYGFDEEEFNKYLKENESSQDNQNKEDDSQFDTLLEFVTETKREPVWKGANIRDFLARPGQKRLAFPITQPPAKEEDISDSSESEKYQSPPLKDSSNGKKRAHSADSASSASSSPSSFWSSSSDSTVSAAAKEQLDKILDTIGNNPKAWDEIDRFIQEKKKRALENSTPYVPTQSS